MSANDEKKIWFPAKKYGYGWGPPNCWQGWVVIAVFFVLMVCGAFLMPKHPIVFFVHTLVSVSVLITICYLKGEKPGWRWGDKE